MDVRRNLILVLAIAALASCVMPAGAFLGAGISLNKHLGDTVDFKLNPMAAQAAGIAYGQAAMDLGVTWGVDYDLNSLAGYPYGYGGVGAVTDANLGYSLGLSLDETHGTGFDGSAFGIPLTEGSLSSTKYDNLISAKNHLQDVQVALPYY
jgi:hypothetical protein